MTLKTMMLITVPFTQQEKSFRLIPMTKDAPFLDVVYWKDKKVLEVLVPFKKNDYNMFHKLDENGDPEKRKTPGKDQNGNPKLFKEERKLTEVMMNYYIIEQTEIISFIEAVAINADKVDYMSILMGKDAVLEAPKPSIIMPS